MVKVKRKGKYEYDLDWHQNHSALVVPKVAEKVLVEGYSIRETIEKWDNIYDFFMRIKVTRGSRLVAEVEGCDDIELERTQRYYVAKGGIQMVKIMPPLAKKPDVFRRIAVESGWKVCPCNDINHATLPIDFNYYIQETEKLCLSVM